MPGEPIYPNQADADAYERALLRSFMRPVYDAIEDGLRAAEGRAAGDLKRKLENAEFQPRLDDDVPQAEIEASLRRMQRRHDREMRRTFANALAVDVTPILRDRGEVEAHMRRSIDRNVSLITTIPEDLHGDLRRRMESSVFDDGRFIDEQRVAELVQLVGRMGGYRLRRIVRDQNSKMTGQLTEIRHRQAGITHYRWSTSRDERVRPTHVSKEGRMFAWSNPPEDTGHPGDDIMCRCAAAPVITDPLKRKVEEEESEEAEAERERELPPQEELARYGYELETDAAYQAPPSDYAAMREFLEAGYSDALNETPLVTEGYVSPSELRQTFDLADETWTNADLDALADQRPWFNTMFRGVMVVQSGTTAVNAGVSLYDFGRSMDLGMWDAFRLVMTALAGTQVLSPLTARIGDLVIRLGRRYVQLMQDWETDAARRAKVRVSIADLDTAQDVPILRPATPPPAVRAVPVGYTAEQRYEWIRVRIEEVRGANPLLDEDDLYVAISFEFDKLFGTRGRWLGIAEYRGEPRVIFVRRRTKEWLDEFPNLTQTEAAERATLEYDQGRWTGWLPPGSLDVRTRPPSYPKQGQSKSDWLDTRMRHLRQDNPGLTDRRALRHASAEWSQELWHRYDPYVAARKTVSRLDTPRPDGRRGRKEWVRAHARLLRLHEPSFTVQESFVMAQVEWVRSEFPPPVARPVAGRRREAWLRERAAQLNRFDAERYGTGFARARIEWDMLSQPGLTVPPEILPDVGSVVDVSQALALNAWQTRLMNRYRLELKLEMTVEEVIDYARRWWSRHGVGEMPELTFTHAILHHGVAEEVGGREILMYLRSGLVEQSAADEFRMTKGVLVQKLTSVLMDRLYQNTLMVEEAPAPRSKEFAALLARMYESDVVDDLSALHLMGEGVDFDAAVDTVDWARRVARAKAMNEYQSELEAHIDGLVRFTGEAAEDYAGRVGSAPDGVRHANVGLDDAPSYARSRPHIDATSNGFASELNRRSTSPAPPNLETPSPPDYLDLLRLREVRITGASDDTDDYLVRTSRARFGDAEGMRTPQSYVEDRVAVLMEYNESHGYTLRDAQDHATREFADLFSEALVDHWSSEVYKMLTPATPPAPTYTALVNGELVDLSGQALVLEIAGRVQELSGNNPLLSLGAARKLAHREFNSIRGDVFKPHMTQSGGAVLDVKTRDVVEMLPFGDDATPAQWIEAQARVLMRSDDQLRRSEAVRKANAQLDWLAERGDADLRSAPRAVYADAETGGVEEEALFARLTETLVKFGLVDDRALFADDVKRMTSREWVESSFKRPPQLRVRPKLDAEFAAGVQGLHDDDVIHLLYTANEPEPQTSMTAFLHELGHALHQRYLLATDEVPSGAAGELGEVGRDAARRMNHSPTYRGIMLRLLEKHAGLRLRTRPAVLGGRREVLVDFDVEDLIARGATDEDVAFLTGLTTPDFDLADIRRNAVRRGMSRDTLLTGVADEPTVLTELPAEEMARLYGSRRDVFDRGLRPDSVLGVDTHSDLWRAAMEIEIEEWQKLPFRLITSRLSESDYIYLRFDEGRPPVRIPRADANVPTLGARLPRNVEEMYVVLHDWVNRMKLEWDIEAPYSLLLRRAALEFQVDPAAHLAYSRLRYDQVPLNPVRPPMVAVAEMASDSVLTSRNLDQFNEFRLMMMAHRFESYNPWFSSIGSGRRFTSQMLADGDRGVLEQIPIAPLSIRQGESFADFLERRTAELKPSFQFETRDSLKLWATMEWKSVDGVDLTDVPRTPFDNPTDYSTAKHRQALYQWEGTVLEAPHPEEGDLMIPMDIEETEAFVREVWSKVDIGEDIEVVWWSHEDAAERGAAAGVGVGEWSGNRLFLFPDPRYTKSYASPEGWRTTKLTVLHELSHGLHVRLQAMAADNMRPGVYDQTPFFRAMADLTGHDPTMFALELRMLDEFHEGLDYDTMVRSVQSFNSRRKKSEQLLIDPTVDGVQWAREQARLLGFTDEMLETARNRRPARVTTRVFEPSEVRPRMPAPLRGRMVEGETVADAHVRAAKMHDEADLFGAEGDEWTTPVEKSDGWDTEIDETWEWALDDAGSALYPVPDFDPSVDDFAKWVDDFAEWVYDNGDPVYDADHAKAIAVLWFGRHHSHKLDMDSYGNLAQEILETERRNSGSLPNPFDAGHYEEGSVEFFMALIGANRLAAQRKLDADHVVLYLRHVDLTDREAVAEAVRRVALPVMPSDEALGIPDFDPIGASDAAESFDDQFSGDDFGYWLSSAAELMADLNPGAHVAGAKVRAQFLADVIFAEQLASQVPVDQLRRVARLSEPIPEGVDRDEWLSETVRALQSEMGWLEADAERVATYIWRTRDRGFNGTRREAIDEIFTDANTQNMLYAVQGELDDTVLPLDERYLTISETKAYMEMVWRAFGVNEAVELHVQLATDATREQGLQGYTMAGANWIRIIFDEDRLPSGFGDAKLALAAEEGGILLSKSTVLHEMTHLLVHRGLVGREHNPLGSIAEEAYSVAQEAYHNHSEVFATLLAHMRKEFFDGLEVDDFMARAKAAARRTRERYHQDGVHQQAMYLPPEVFEAHQAAGAFDYDDEVAIAMMGDIRFAPDVVKSPNWARENAMLGGMTEATVMRGVDKRVAYKMVDAEPDGMGNIKSHLRMESRSSYSADAWTTDAVQELHPGLTDDHGYLPPDEFKWDVDSGESPQEWIERYAQLIRELEPTKADNAVNNATYWFSMWFSDEMTAPQIRRFLADDTPAPFDPNDWRAKAFTKWPDGDTSRWRQLWVEGHVGGVVSKNGWLNGLAVRNLLNDDYRLGLDPDWGSPYAGGWRRWRSSPIKEDTDPVDWIDAEGARLSERYLPSLTESEGKALAAMHWWRRHDTDTDVADLDYMFFTDETLRARTRSGQWSGSADIQRSGAYEREQLAYELWEHMLAEKDDPDDYEYQHFKKLIDFVRDEIGYQPGDPIPAGIRIGTAPMSPKEATYYMMRWWAARSGIREPPSISFRLLHENDEAGLLGVAQGGAHVSFIVDPNTGKVKEWVVNHEMAHAAGYRGVNRGLATWSHEGSFNPSHGKVFTGLTASNAMAETGMPSSVWTFAYYLEESGGGYRYRDAKFMQGPFANPYWTRHKAMHDLATEGPPQFGKSLDGVLSEAAVEALRPHMEGVYPKDFATIDLFEGLTDRPDVLIDRELVGIVGADEVPEWATWEFVDPKDKRWVVDDYDTNFRSATSAAVEEEEVAEDAWDVNRWSKKNAGDGQTHFDADLTENSDYWPTIIRGFVKADVSSAYTGSKHKDLLPPSISRLTEAEQQERSRFVPGRRLIDWFARRHEDASQHTTKSAYTESYDQTYTPQWLVRVRTDADVDDLSAPTLDEVKRQFLPDMPLALPLEDGPDLTGVASTIEEARSATGPVVFDELRMPAGVFVESSGNLKTVHIEMYLEETDGTFHKTVGAYGYDLAPIHEVKLVAEYEDVWISRRTGAPATDAVPTESMTDAEIKEKFPHMFKVDRYRVWSVDHQLDPTMSRQRAYTASRQDLPPLPREPRDGNTLDEEVQQRATLLAWHYRMWSERMSPDYEPTDEADRVLTEFKRREFEELASNVRREYELIDAGFITGTRDDEVLDADKWLDWPDGLQSPRFSALFDGRDRSRAPDGFPSSSSEMSDWMEHIRNWQDANRLEADERLDTVSERYYAVLDEYQSAFRRARARGFNAKTDRSPKHSPEMELPLKDAGYDRDKIRKLHHVLGVQREFIELDKASGNPVDWGKYIVEQASDALDQGRTTVFGLFIDEDSRLPYVNLVNPEWRDEFDKMTGLQKVEYQLEHGVDELPDEHIVFYPFDADGELTPLTPEIEAAMEATRVRTLASVKKSLEASSEPIWMKAEMHRDGSHIDYDTGMAQDRLGTSAALYVGHSWDLREMVRKGLIHVDDDDEREALLFAADMFDYGSPTGKRFTAWRGLRLQDDESFQMARTGVIEGLTSTTLDMPQAEGFANQHGKLQSIGRGNAVLQVFDVRAGSHGIFIGAGETEFVLPQGTRVELVYEERDVLIIDSRLDDPYRRALGFDYVQYFRVVPDEVAGGDNEKTAMRFAPKIREKVEPAKVDDWDVDEEGALEEDTLFWVAVPAGRGAKHDLREELTPFLRVERESREPMRIFRDPEEAAKWPIASSGEGVEKPADGSSWDLVEVLVEAGSLVQAVGGGEFQVDEDFDSEFDVVPLAIYWGTQLPDAVRGRGFRRYYVTRGARRTARASRY